MTNIYIFKYTKHRIYRIGRNTVNNSCYESARNYLDQVCPFIESFSPLTKLICKDISGYVIPFDLADPILDTLEVLGYDLRNGIDGYPLARHYE